MVGHIKAIGKGVKTLEVGQRVGVGWIADSCRACPACLRGDENVCIKGYRGLIIEGTCQFTIRHFALKVMI